MAQNDMEVIMYKILSYMYECMKAGARPRMEDICYTCQMFQIPKPYWEQIMKELITRGLLSGFLMRQTKDGLIICMADNPAITYEGRQFLVENSGMKRAASFLGNAFGYIKGGKCRIV